MFLYVEDVDVVFLATSNNLMDFVSENLNFIKIGDFFAATTDELSMNFWFNIMIKNGANQFFSIISKKITLW